MEKTLQTRDEAWSEYVEAQREVELAYKLEKQSRDLAHVAETFVERALYRLNMSRSALESIARKEAAPVTAVATRADEKADLPDTPSDY